MKRIVVRYHGGGLPRVKDKKELRTW